MLSFQKKERKEKRMEKQTCIPHILNPNELEVVDLHFAI